MSKQDVEFIAPKGTTYTLKYFYDTLYSGSDALLRKPKGFTRNNSFLQSYFPPKWYTSVFGDNSSFTESTQKNYRSWFITAHEVQKTVRSLFLDHIKMSIAKDGSPFDQDGPLGVMQAACKTHIAEELNVDLDKFNNKLVETGKALFDELWDELDWKKAATISLELCLTIAPEMALSRLLVTAALRELLTEPDLFSYIWPSPGTIRKNPVLRELLGESDAQTIAAEAMDRYNSGDFEEALLLMENAVALLSDSSRSCDDAAIWFTYGQWLQENGRSGPGGKPPALYISAAANVGFAPALYTHAKNQLQSGGSREEVFKAMKKAADAGSLEANYDLGFAYFSGDKAIVRQKDFREAKTWFEKCSSLPAYGHGAMVAQCEYMLGEIALAESTIVEKDGVTVTYEAKIEEAKVCFRAAAAKGNIPAEARLRERDWWKSNALNTQKRQKQFYQPVKCFLRNNHENNLFFARSLFGADNHEDIICTPSSKREASNAEPDIITNLRRYFEEAKQQTVEESWVESLPLLLFAFLDPDESMCLNDSIHLVEMLQDTMEVIPERHHRLFTERIRIYVRSTRQSTSLILDSALSAMKGNLHFPIRIYDPDQEAAQQLLSRYPLFIPCLDARQDKINLVILGDSRCAKWLVKEALAIAYLPNHPISITMISPQAAQAEASLRQECPGLFSTEGSLCSCTPTFITCASLRELNIFHKNSEGVSSLIHRGNYFVVATDDDFFNLEFSVTLRSALMSRSLNFTRAPVIAVHCSRERIAWQADHLAVGTEAMGVQWFNNYNLKCFGMQEKLLSFDSLENGLIERRAREIHCSYYDVTYGSDDAYTAMTDYYQRGYNRDSSRVTAASLIYRAFAAGIALTGNLEIYGSAEHEMKLADEFEQWLSGEDGDAHEETAAIAEHQRWNQFMLSRGWRSARISQVEAYMRQGNPRQQLYIAKLHPYICKWDELPQKHSAVDRLIRKIWPGKRLGDPREIDRDSIIKTATFVKAGYRGKLQEVISAYEPLREIHSDAKIHPEIEH